MTREETAKLLEILRVAYPKHYKDMTKADASKTVNLYHSRLKDYPTALVIEALNAYIDENEYPPTIAGIKRYLTRFEGEHDYEAMFTELWKAICGNKKFTDLCEPNQKYIGSQQALDNMGTDERTIMEVVKGQYMKRIPEIVGDLQFTSRVEMRIGTEGVAELKARLNSAGRRLLGGEHE